MSLRFCQSCQSLKPMEADDAMGHVVCTGCGGVMEENAIVAEVGFMENAKGAAIAEGFSMGKDKARVVRRAQGHRGKQLLGGQESRETTIANGFRKIQDIAYQSQIKMNDRQIDSAQRFFNLAVQNNFYKGRKLNTLAAACLYCVCREEKTSHMLIDFSDALSTNVYQIGATFLKLVQILHLNLPVVDPSLYIIRFAARLDFGDDTSKIIHDANRLVQRMKRDWIEHGRKPAGICAACLYVAARMNGHSRGKHEVVSLARICTATLDKRLKEFMATDSAQLTVEEFQDPDLWLPDAKLPPCAQASKKRKRQDGEEEEEEEEDYFSDIDEDGMIFTSDEITQAIEDAQEEARRQGRWKEDDEDEDANLSALDSDPEVSGYIISGDDEAEDRRHQYEIEFKDWELKKQLKDKEKENKQSNTPKPKKPRLKKPKQILSGSTPVEATMNLLNSKPRTSKKINYEVIRGLFDLDEGEMRRKEAVGGKLVWSEDSVMGLVRERKVEVLEEVDEEY